jgi:aryl-alcohol dehydrogenase-like predicted oxidoreductase
MKTDVIDLYQVREWDGLAPLDETMEVLDRAVRHGRVCYLGCSNFSGWHIVKALGVAEREHFQRFVSQQIHYTLETPDAETSSSQ